MDLKAHEDTNFGDLSNLDVNKLQELGNILASILALPVAQEAFSQIIAGQPTRSPFSDDVKTKRCYMHETFIDSNTAKPSSQAVGEYENIRKAFTPQGLKIDLNLAQRYQNAPFGSPEHQLRLLEIVAASVHTLAGMVYISFHENTDIKPAAPPEGHHWQFNDTDHFYVNFYHSEYMHLDDYPFGLLNVVGYWAETEIFGGVVLFEHDESGSTIINAFVQPQRTWQASEVSGKQLDSFTSLGVPGPSARSSSAAAILPFSKEPNTRTELAYVRAGEGPLRIYKNDYDKAPVAYISEESECVVFGKDDERAAPLEEAFKRLKEDGHI